MNNFLLIILTICLILNPRRAFTEKTATPKADGSAKADERSLSLSDSDIDSSGNPFVDKFPRPIEPEVSPFPVSVTTPPTNQNPPQPLGEGPSTPDKSQTTTSPKLAKPAEIKLPSFTINGLVWNTDKPQAIINNKVLSVGDSIEDFVIVGINETGVEVLFQGKKFNILYK